MAVEKLRPAVVVGRSRSPDVVLAFITSRLDTEDPKAEHVVALDDPEFAGTGLRVASRVRLDKLATISRPLIRRRLGRLGPHARTTTARALRYVFGL
jgi:mRNA interferase MazF